MGMGASQGGTHGRTLLLMSPAQCRRGARQAIRLRVDSGGLLMAYQQASHKQLKPTEISNCCVTGVADCD